MGHTMWEESQLPPVSNQQVNSREVRMLLVAAELLQVSCRQNKTCTKLGSIFLMTFPLRTDFARASQQGRGLRILTPQAAMSCCVPMGGYGTPFVLLTLALPSLVAQVS